MIEAMRGLGLKGMAGAFDEAVTTGLQRQRPTAEILTDLLRAEATQRHTASIRYRMTAAKSPELKWPFCQKRSYGRHRQKQPKRIGSQRRKAIAEVQSLAPRNLRWVAAIEHIQHDDRNAEGLRRSGKAGQAIDQQITAIALPLNAAVDADHRYVGSGNAAVGRPCPREAARKFCVFDSMCIRCVEAHHIAS